MNQGYSDQNRKGLFNGTALDYVRLRAKKWEEIYGNEKQGKHLKNLADLVERELKQLKVNERWLIEQIDAVHSILCSNRVGTWQDRARQVVKAAKKIEAFELETQKINQSLKQTPLEKGD